MDDFVLQGLRYGASIELYYSLKRSGSKGEAVWWPATVEKLSFIHDTRGPTLSASIRFSPMYGFRACVKTVVFENKDQVRDRNNVHYTWRFPPEESLPSPGSQSHQQGDVSSSEEQPTDEDYCPNGKGTQAGKRKKLEASNDPFDEIRDKVQDNRQYESLERAVKQIQNVVKQHTAMLSHLHTERVISSLEEGKEELLPLEFLRLRLVPFLEKPPPASTRPIAGELRQGFQFFSQEHFRRSSDCTLSQFDHVLEYVHRTAGKKAVFHPSYEIVKATPQAEIRISFLSFESLAGIFAPISSQLLRKVIFKQKLERGTGKITGVRVLGCVVQSEQEPSLPMYLTVGAGLPHTQGDEDMVVLKRENILWNDVENIFRKPLCLLTTTSKQLLSTAENILSSDEICRMQERSSFGIMWKRESHLDLERVFAPAPKQYDVLGTLEVTIPYVLVKNDMTCTEVVRLSSNLPSTS